MNDDTSFAQLTGSLQAWHGRKQIRDALIWGPRGTLAGLMVAATLAVASRLRPLLDNDQIAYAALGCGLCGLLLTLGALLLRRATLIQQARFADRQFGLQERASTAVEIYQGALTAPPNLAQQQLADTVRAIATVDARARLPFQVQRRDWLLLLITTLLLVTAVRLPNPQETALKQSRAVRQSIAEQITALEALEQEIMNNPDLTEEQREALLQPIESALADLSAADSQEQAVATLSEAEAEMRALSDQFSRDDLQERLTSAAQPLADNAAGQSLGAALQNGQLSQAGAAAAQLADSLPNLSSEELAQLAQSLAQTAAALQDVDSELAQQLADAAAALQNGDITAAQQALRQAAGTLQQRAQETAAAQQAQAAAGQLQQGRQEVAQSGQSGQQGTGQGEGEGQGQGQGEGQGQGQGQGEGQGQGQGAGSEQGTGTGGPGPGGGHVENIFVPNNWADLSDITGVDVELPAECIANPALCGGLLSETPTEFATQGSTVPYSQVFGDYRNAAYEALSNNYIPLGLKGYIRDYFSSLEP